MDINQEMEQLLAEAGEHLDFKKKKSKAKIS